MSSTSNQARQIVTGGRRSRLVRGSTASTSRSLPRPVATRPASQRDTRIPQNVYKLTEEYPRHPLLAFFNTDTRNVFPSPEAKQETEVKIPAALCRSDLSEDKNSRGWLAPELRTKSSLELHQLWYKCLMERNRIHTTLDELRRRGIESLAALNQYNGYDINRRVKKTMARIKFVLNERRLALLEAQQKAAVSKVTSENPISEKTESLYEDSPSV